MTIKQFTIWDVLSDSEADAEELRIRHHLARELSSIVHGWGIAQKEAASRLKISSPRLSDLIQGRIAKFSSRSLIKMLIIAGAKVEIAVQPNDAL